MSVFNPRGSDSIKTSCSPKELSQALQALHLDTIHPALRKIVILARLGEVVLKRTTSPTERAKPAFEAIEKTYWERRTIQGV